MEGPIARPHCRALSQGPIGGPYWKPRSAASSTHWRALWRAPWRAPWRNSMEPLISLSRLGFDPYSTFQWRTLTDAKQPCKSSLLIDVVAMTVVQNAAPSSRLHMASTYSQQDQYGPDFSEGPDPHEVGRPLASERTLWDQGGPLVPEGPYGGRPTKWRSGGEAPGKRTLGLIGGDKLEALASIGNMVQLGPKESNRKCALL